MDNNTIFLADELTMAKAKTVRTLSIIALSLSVVYFFEGFLGILVSLLPLPGIGVLISLFLSLVEFVLLVASAICCIMALVRSLSLVKEISLLPDTVEKVSALGIAKVARLLSIIAISITGFFCIFFSLLNIFEFLLSII